MKHVAPKNPTTKDPAMNGSDFFGRADLRFLQRLPDTERVQIQADPAVCLASAFPPPLVCFLPAGVDIRQAMQLDLFEALSCTYGQWKTLAFDESAAIVFYRSAG